MNSSCGKSLLCETVRLYQVCMQGCHYQSPGCSSSGGGGGSSSSSSSRIISSSVVVVVVGRRRLVLVILTTSHYQSWTELSSQIVSLKKPMLSTYVGAFSGFGGSATAVLRGFARWPPRLVQQCCSEQKASLGKVCTRCAVPLSISVCSYVGKHVIRSGSIV